MDGAGGDPMRGASRLSWKGPKLPSPAGGRGAGVREVVFRLSSQGPKRPSPARGRGALSHQLASKPGKARQGKACRSNELQA